MDRDELIDRLYAIAHQHADEWITLDGNIFSVKDVCLEAGKQLQESCDFENLKSELRLWTTSSGAK